MKHTARIAAKAPEAILPTKSVIHQVTPRSTGIKFGPLYIGGIATLFKDLPRVTLHGILYNKLLFQTEPYTLLACCLGPPSLTSLRGFYEQSAWVPIPALSHASWATSNSQFPYL